MHFDMKLELILGGYFERLPSKRGPCPMLLLSPFSGLRASDCEEVDSESWDLLFGTGQGSILSRKTAGASS